MDVINSTTFEMDFYFVYSMLVDIIEVTESILAVLCLGTSLSAQQHLCLPREDVVRNMFSRRQIPSETLLFWAALPSSSRDYGRYAHHRSITLFLLLIR